MKTLRNLQNFLFIILVFIASPTFSQISGNNNVCSNENEIYISNTSAYRYQWNVTGSASYLAQNDSLFVVWSNNSNGQISLIGFDSLGNIQFTQQLNITIKASPNPYLVSDFNSSCFYVDEHNTPHLTSDTCFVACKGKTFNYFAKQGSSAYDWEITGAKAVCD